MAQFYSYKSLAQQSTVIDGDRSQKGAGVTRKRALAGGLDALPVGKPAFVAVAKINSSECA